MGEKIGVLGVNPGTKYTAWAVFRGTELRDWGVKTLKGRWSAQKIKATVGFLGLLAARYGIRRLAIKTLNPCRTSANLERLTAAIVRRLSTLGLSIEARSIEELKAFFAPDGKKINGQKLAELVAREYPPPYPLLEKEKQNRNSYYQGLFEAVALGSLAARSA